MDKNLNLDHSTSPVQFKLYNMNTKKNKSEAFKIKAALEAKALIESWHPDIVICANDNASKYLIAPYYKESEIPFVFFGVNWSAAEYGFPTANITGMTEVDWLRETISLMKPYARGGIGYIGADNISNRKKLPYHRQMLGAHYTDGILVTDYEQWEKEYLRLQNTVDMLLLFPCVSAIGWDDNRAKAFTVANTKITTGSTDESTGDMSLVGG